MPASVVLQHLATHHLQLRQGVILLGLAHDGTLWLDEMRHDDTLIRHGVLPDGRLHSVDEQTRQPLPNLPANMQTPITSPDQHPLNRASVRQRGLREADRVGDWVRPMPVMQKMALIQVLALDVSPMQVLGLGESRVLSLAQLSPTEQLVCRRVALMLALPQAQLAQDGQPYDYTTHSIHMAHRYQPNAEDEVPLDRLLGALAGVRLRQPVDCLVANNHLYIADDGNGETCNALHIWQIAPA